MAMDCIGEENKVPVDGEYQVIVVGGGVAGVSAALAARRLGCSTLIIEKGVMLGGLATLGLIGWYLPLCDGRGRKIIGGIAEELLFAAIKYGYDDLPPEWASGGAGPATGARYSTKFSPPAFVLALDELVEQEGIDILFDTVFCRPVVGGGLCTHVIVENKSGRKSYRGQVFVDTTGDADVMARAGATCAEGENWLSYWAYSTSLEKMREAVEKGSVARGISLQWWGGDNTGKGAPEGAPKYGGTDAREITRFILDGRRMVREGLKNASKAEEALLALPAMAQLRTTRRICGGYTLTEDDILKHFDDSVGCTGDWRKPGPVFEIPYRTLVSPDVGNVITAGRTISSAGDAWEVTRVIPPASLTGQAAGTAAALAVRRGCGLQEIDVQELQHELARTGVLIHF